MLTVLRYDHSLVPLSHCFLATARSCLAHLIARYMPGRVVMPGVVPDGLIVPFEKAGVHIDHYRLRADLSPDIEDMKNLMARSSLGRPLIVIVHYFGYPMPTCDAAILAHQLGGLLLSDYAQCLVNPDTQNDCSDLALYSLNKVLPISDGAIMFSRSPEADVNLKTKLEPLDSSILDAYTNHLAMNRLVRKAVGREAMLCAHEMSSNYYSAYYDGISANLEPRLPSARALSAHENVDTHSIVAQRRKNAAAVIRRLLDRQLWRKDAPTFALPVRCQDRMWSAERFADAGIVPEFFKDHWRPPARGRSFEVEWDLWENHLLLPISEDMSPGEVARVAATARWDV